MSQERKGRRIGLRTKLNCILIASILLTSIGLVRISYRIYSRKVDSLYMDKSMIAASAVSHMHHPYHYLTILREMVDSDEFQQVRAQALAAQDESILKDWNRSRSAMIIMKILNRKIPSCMWMRMGTCSSPSTVCIKPMCTTLQA